MKLRRILTVLLAVCLLFTVAACKKTGGNGNGGKKDDVKGTDYLLHYTDKSLHNVNVDFENNLGTFIKDNATSDYKIVVQDGEGIDTTKASELIRNQVRAASGCTLSKIVYDGEAVNEVDINFYEGNSKYIFINCDLFYATDTDLKMPDYEVIGVAGYYIKTYESNVFIMAYSDQGYQMGAISFLREVLGYDMLADDCVYFSNIGEVMPKMEIIERPDFDFRQQDDSLMGPVEPYGMGFTTGTIFLQSSEYPWVHNIRPLLGLDPSEAAAANDPFNVKDENGESKIVDEVISSFHTTKQKRENAVIERKWFCDDSSRWQACFTAHGDPESYLRMVDYAANTLLYYAKITSVNNIMISPMDVTGTSPEVKACNCEACKASQAYYNGTMGGAFISFVNDVAIAFDELKEALKEEFPVLDREINIVYLAYGSGISAPTKCDAEGVRLTDENGKGIPTTQKWFGYNEDGVLVSEGIDWEEAFPEKYPNPEQRDLVCAPDVQIMYAASGANWIHSMYDDINANVKAQQDAWSGLGGKMYVWGYEVCYWNYLYPYNSYDSLMENFRYFKELDCKWVYMEGTYENHNASGFDKLREYINARGLFDVNLRYSDLVNDWFDRYFMEAAKPMREMFDICNITLRWANENNIAKYTGVVHSDAIADPQIFSYQLIKQFMDLIDEAYRAIEIYNEPSSLDLYNALHEHILIESLFPRFALATTYQNYFDNDEDLLEFRKAFKVDFQRLNPGASATNEEHHKMTEVFDAWGI